MKRGTSIVEVIIYMGVLIIMVVAIVVGIIQMAQVFGRTRNERKVATAAENVLDRMLREVRLARNVVTGCSSAPACLDIIGLPAFDSPLSVFIERKVTLSGGKFVLDSGGTTEDLTPPDVVITNFTVTPLSVSYLSKTSVSQGIKINFTVSTGGGKYLATHDYTGTAILRHSYP